MLRALIMGPAGSGKGTNSELICKKYNVAHIATGDMFREHIQNKTPLGLKASEYMSTGHLVPDDVTIAMVKERIKQDDCQNGFLLDGFPRSLAQAQAIDDLHINCVINLIVDYDSLVERIANRRVCKDCGTIYHLHSRPSKVEGICDVCGGQLYQRSDDTFEKLQVRLTSYDNETAPVVEYYRQKSLVKDFDGDIPRELVFENISNYLNEIIKENK